MLQRLIPFVVLLAAASLSLSTVAGSVPPNGFDAWAEVWDVLRPAWSDRDNDEPGLLSQEDLVALDEYNHGSGGPPTARQLEAFARLDRLAPMMEAAARTSVFEPNLQYEDGFMMLMPHLSQMRQSSRLMAALSRRDLAAGDTASAAKWASMMGRMSSQSVQGSPLIGALVSSAIYAQSDQAFQRVVDSGELDPGLARTMLDELDWATASEDPFGFVTSIEIEGDLMRNQFARLIDDLESGNDDELRQVVGIGGGDLADLLAARGEDLGNVSTIMSEFYDATLEAARDPDRARGLESIELLENDLLENSDSMLAKFMMPSFSRTLKARIRVENLLTDRVRLLEGIARGRISPESLANAARLWDRIGGYFEDLPVEVQCAGLELLGSLPDDARVFDLLARSNMDPDSPLRPQADEGDGRSLAGIRDDPLGPWLAGVRSEIDAVIDLAIDAAAIRHADFPADGTRLAPGVRIHNQELERLRAAGRGLLADATARLRIATTLDTDEQVLEQRTRATNEIVAVLALIGDLLNDPAAVHIVLAADLMHLLGDLLESPEAIALLETASLRDRIGPALTSTPRENAMGVHAAIAVDVELLAETWSRGANSEEVEAEALDALSRRSPDRAFGILTEAAGFSIRPNVDDPLAAPTPVTPWPIDPEASEETLGRRPLKLLASFDGIHGDDWVMSRTNPGLDSYELRRRLEEDPGRTEAAVAELEPRTPYPLSASAVLALDRLAALDRLVRDIGRRSE